MELTWSCAGSGVKYYEVEGCCGLVQRATLQVHYDDLDLPVLLLVQCGGVQVAYIHEYCHATSRSAIARESVELYHVVDGFPVDRVDTFREAKYVHVSEEVVGVIVSLFLSRSLCVVVGDLYVWVGVLGLLYGEIEVPHLTQHRLYSSLPLIASYLRYCWIQMQVFKSSHTTDSTVVQCAIDVSWLLSYCRPWTALCVQDNSLQSGTLCFVDCACCVWLDWKLTSLSFKLVLVNGFSVRV